MLKLLRGFPGLLVATEGVQHDDIELPRFRIFRVFGERVFGGAESFVEATGLDGVHGGVVVFDAWCGHGRNVRGARADSKAERNKSGFVGKIHLTTDEQDERR